MRLFALIPQNTNSKFWSGFTFALWRPHTRTHTHPVVRLGFWESVCVCDLSDNWRAAAALTCGLSEILIVACDKPKNDLAKAHTPAPTLAHTAKLNINWITYFMQTAQTARHDTTATPQSPPSALVRSHLVSCCPPSTCALHSPQLTFVFAPRTKFSVSISVNNNNNNSVGTPWCPPATCDKSPHLAKVSPVSKVKGFCNKLSSVLFCVLLGPCPGCVLYIY